jgi:hypothetical protein
MSCLDITPLSAFVTAAQQDHELIAVLGTVDPVARSMIEAQLEDAATSNRLPVTAKADPQSINSSEDAHTRRLVSKSIDPLTERAPSIARLVFPDFRHCSLKAKFGQSSDFIYSGRMKTPCPQR